MPATADTQLNAQEQRFVDEYMIDLDAERAALAAGYSKSMAASKCFTWVSQSKANPKLHVRAEVERRRAAMSSAKIMDATETMETITKLARANLPIHVTAQGDPYIDLNDADENVRAALGSVEIHDYTDGRGDDAREVRKVKVTMHPKLGALGLLAKHHGLVTDKVELTLTEGFADRMARAAARAKEGR